MNSIVQKSAVLLITLMAVLSTTAYADRGDHDRRDKYDKYDRRDRNNDNNRHQRSAPDYQVDKRYNHNRAYPRDGRIVKILPERRSPIRYRNRDYFYFGGVWYLPSGAYFTVIRPPIGIIVPILPPYYTTIWLSGVPYYYANDTYYLWRPDLNSYQVTPPPVVENESAPPYSADELFIYPKQGQNEQQQADDRYACHRWGVEQSKYDPTQPPGNLSVDALSRLREDYHRAMKSCLAGRGYSVS